MQSGLRSGLWEQQGGTTTPMSALDSQLDWINCQIIYHQPEESLQLITLNISQPYYSLSQEVVYTYCMCSIATHMQHAYTVRVCMW